MTTQTEHPFSAQPTTTPGRLLHCGAPTTKEPTTMADYVNLTIADAIAQVEAEWVQRSPRGRLGETVLYTFRSLAGSVEDRPAVVHGVLADGTLALTVFGANELSGAPVAERRGVEHDPNGTPGTWRYLEGDWR